MHIHFEYILFRQTSTWLFSITFLQPLPEAKGRLQVFAKSTWAWKCMAVGAKLSYTRGERGRAMKHISNMSRPLCECLSAPESRRVTAFEFYQLQTLSSVKKTEPPLDCLSLSASLSSLSLSGIISLAIKACKGLSRGKRKRGRGRGKVEVTVTSGSIENYLSASRTQVLPEVCGMTPRKRSWQHGEKRNFFFTRQLHCFIKPVYQHILNKENEELVISYLKFQKTLDWRAWGSRRGWTHLGDGVRKPASIQSHSHLSYIVGEWNDEKASCFQELSNAKAACHWTLGMQIRLFFKNYL